MSIPSRLILKDVSHSFGIVTAVSDVSLSIAAGEIHCLLGPSGSGKSTLLRIISGLERQQQGSVLIDGQTVSNSSTHLPVEHRPVGFVFQDFALFPHLNAIRNVLFGMPNRRSIESRAKAEQLLTDVGLSNRMKAMPHTLSGGEQQRVALARALARTPKVMLLDEPFSGLDVQLRAELRDTTLRVLRSAGVATVMVTHDPSEAISCADQISVMHCGKTIQTGKPQDIYHQPADERIANTFGMVNRIPVETRNGIPITPYGQLLTDVLPSDASTVFVRPERLRIKKSTADDSKTDCHIERIVNEGATDLYELRTADDSRLLVRTLSGGELVSGKVAVKIR
jgi:iron(III) transport system ATP-binding protein